MLVSILQSLFALAATLGLFGVGVVLVRRYGPRGLSVLRPAGPRRLELLESLTLGPHHRLVLVRAGAEERLILLGDGSLAPDRAPAP